MATGQQESRAPSSAQTGQLEVRLPVDLVEHAALQLGVEAVLRAGEEAGGHTGQHGYAGGSSTMRGAAPAAPPPRHVHAYRLASLLLTCCLSIPPADAVCEQRVRAVGAQQRGGRVGRVGRGVGHCAGAQT